MRAHTDEEIIEKASAEENNFKEVASDRINVTIDLKDEHDTAHTYVVNFCKDSSGAWKAVEVSELSSL
jgi:hypothetical protein